MPLFYNIPRERDRDQAISESLPHSAHSFELNMGRLCLDMVFFIIPLKSQSCFRTQ